MGKGRKSHVDDSDMRHSIRSNLRTIKQTIDDYEMTPDSIEFIAETTKLRDELLRLALKYHVLINAKGSKELRKAAKQEDPEFAEVLEDLSKTGKKGGANYINALKNLDAEVTLETEAALNKVGEYHLSDAQLTKLAEAAMQRVHKTTAEFKKEIQAATQRTATPRSSISSPTDSPRGALQRQYASRGLLFTPRNTIESSDDKPDDRPEDKSTSPDIGKKK